MCIQPADAVNVIGGGKYFGTGLAAASCRAERRPSR
jgi:hypothetical protein